MWWVDVRIGVVEIKAVHILGETYTLHIPSQRSTSKGELGQENEERPQDLEAEPEY